MTTPKDLAPLKLQGVCIVDKIKYTDGHVETMERDHNLVVNSVLPLILALLGNDSNYTGIQYWAVGSGSSTWDTSQPEPELTETQLTNELGRITVDPSNIYFVDDDTFEKIEGTSNTLEIKTTFGLQDCNGTWREFALFGGNATEDINTGVMINKKHHAVLTKTSDMEVERTMRFVISF